MRKVDGYEATFVPGTQICARSEHTGELPGRLVLTGSVGEALRAAE